MSLYEPAQPSTRRGFLSELGALGTLSLGASSITARAALGACAVVDRLPHFAARAKRVIYLTQSGGPSQLELFDPKPDLVKWEGKALPDSIRRGQRVTTMTSQQKQLVMAARAHFVPCGESGIPIGEWLPHIGSVADELCVIRSMESDQINHAPAMTLLLTGHQIPGRASIGAWTSFGLGSSNRNLPDYIVLLSRMRRPSDQPLYEYYWGSGFLPSTYQGVKLRSGREPVLYLNDPAGVSRRVRREMIRGLAKLNAHRAAMQDAQRADDRSEARARTQQYEMAFRMQKSAPEVMDLSTEPEYIFEEYGPDSRLPGSYAANCILARRLAERDVRFVQLFHPDWDHHSKLTAWCPARCRDTDQPTAALIRDLRRRGLLEDTLVVWGGEFGRSVVGQGDFRSPQAGRDHHPKCFSMFMAGAGIRGGTTYGATDDFSFNVVDKPVRVHDLQATILHLLGLDHKRVTYRYQGRDYRLTDVHGTVLHEILS